MKLKTVLVTINTLWPGLINRETNQIYAKDLNKQCFKLLKGSEEFRSVQELIISPSITYKGYTMERYNITRFTSEQLYLYSINFEEINGEFTPTHIRGFESL